VPILCALSMAFAAFASPARATDMPSEIASKLAELGAVVNPPETARLYAPLQEKEPYQGIKVTRDFKYGPDERQALDLFVAEQASMVPRPVLVFVHGGGFTAGNKRGPDNSPFYDNIALFAARNGIVAVNITYRLAPQHAWPAGAEDVSAAARWVAANIAGHGGDPARVVLMGHSAGAVHVAGYVAHPKFHGPRGVGIVGAILVSGFYDNAKMPPGGPSEAYFGTDEAKRNEASTLALLPETKVRLMVAYAELDPPYLVEQAKALGAALCRVNRCSSLLPLPKHSHMSEVYAINTPDTSLSGPIRVFVKGGR
jgi:triacylglycerol lipase